MARIPQKTTRDQLPPDQRHLYDEIISRRGELSGPTAYFINSPRLAVLYSQLTDYLRREGLLNPGQVRLVSLIVAREFDCGYIWGVNLPEAATTGPSAAVVQTIGSRGDVAGLPGEEGVLARYIAALLRQHRVSDATYAAAKAALGEQGVLELNATVSVYTMIANMVNGFEVEPPAGAPRLP